MCNIIILCVLFISSINKQINKKDYVNVGGGEFCLSSSGVGVVVGVGSLFANYIQYTAIASV